MPTQQQVAAAAPPLTGAALDAKLREVTARLVAALKPERVLLFGSHAWGSPDADSDLDLYIVVSDDSEPAHRVARQGHLALRGVGVPVDLVVRTHSQSALQARARSSLDHEALTRGVPLYG